MQLLIRDLTYSLGGLPLLDHVNLNLEAGQRLSLVGRNGAGKTTFLNLILGVLTPDSGEIVRSQGLKVEMLTQEAPHAVPGTTYEIVAGGLGEQGCLLTDYHAASVQLSQGDMKAAKVLDRLQVELDHKNAWNLTQRVDSILTQMRLDGDAPFATLSAGKRRRVLLCRALVAEPDVLLLDEPTNHLDIESIKLIEEYLTEFTGAILFVTHDRAFLRRLATGIIELDRGELLRYDCKYDDYLVKREEYLETQAKQVALFQKKLAQEEVWIRTGIMARRTRNEGRVRALKAMREQAQKIRQAEATARLQIQDASVSGRLVIDARNLSFAFPADEKHALERKILDDFSCRVMRGDRIGILGPNGVGKTTLIKILLDELAPQAGTVRYGTQLQVAYFDQLQEKLDFEKTVLENVNDGSETVTINGQRKHVLGYLEDFLFSNVRAKDKVKFLSGGERNRLLLARLFLKPSNVLVMDEPTNDLDAETLDLLEERLADYPGTILVVSHDRAFLNNVVTSTIAMEGDGFVHEYDGGYDDYLRQRVVPPWERLAEEPQAAKTGQKAKASQKSQTTRSENRLTYKEKMELEKLPAQVESKEEELAALDEQMSDPAFYQKGSDFIAARTKDRETIQDELNRLYARWEELDAKE